MRAAAALVTIAALALPAAGAPAVGPRTPVRIDPEMRPGR
jgi:hypothetical protein